MESVKLTLKDKIRREYGSYEALGAEIGITAQAVAAVVNGHTTGATARYSIAKALGVRVQDFWPEREGAAAA